MQSHATVEGQTANLVFKFPRDFCFKKSPTQRAQSPLNPPEVVSTSVAAGANHHQYSRTGKAVFYLRHSPGQTNFHPGVKPPFLIELVEKTREDLAMHKNVKCIRDTLQTTHSNNFVISNRVGKF